MSTFKTLVDLVINSLEDGKPRLAEAAPDSYREINQDEFWRGVRVVQSWFEEFRVKKGDFVGIISNTRKEWLYVDVASVLSGVVTVPIYPSLKQSDIQSILSQVELKMIFVENCEQEQKVSFSGLPTVSFEGVDIKNYSLHQIGAVKGLKVEKTTPDDLVTIVFTSGTEGTPKGVQQTHRNHVTNLLQVSAVGLFSENDRVMLFLPLAHSFGRLCGYVAVCLGIETAVPAPMSSTSSKLDLTKIVQTFPTVSPTILPSVPRLFEQIRREIEKKLGYLCELLKVPVLSAFLRNTVGIFIKRKIFGNRLKYCISGGAKLNPDTNLFFDRLGIMILEGYGLTETVVATHVNLPHRRKIGSVGQPLPGVSQRVVDEEIQLKGDNIFPGYYKREEQPFTPDGWLSTGDIGYIDSAGYLYITGRKKEILVLSSGKNVPALKVENVVCQAFQAKAAVCFGDGKDFVVAVVFLGDRSVSDHEARKRLEEANNMLNPFERIKGLLVVSDEPTISNGLLTPTLKIRRQEVYSRFNEEINQLWTRSGQVVVLNDVERPQLR